MPLPVAWAGDPFQSEMYLRASGRAFHAPLGPGGTTLDARIADVLLKARDVRSAPSPNCPRFRLQDCNLLIASGEMSVLTVCTDRKADARPNHLYSTKDIRTDAFNIIYGPSLEIKDDINRAVRRLVTRRVEGYQAALARLEVGSIGRARARCNAATSVVDLWHARECAIHNSL